MRLARGFFLTSIALANPQAGEVAANEAAAGAIINDQAMIVTMQHGEGADGSAGDKQVAVTARTPTKILDNIINTKGIVEAKSVSVKNGEIILGVGGNEHVVKVAEKTNASDKNAASTDTLPIIVLVTNIETMPLNLNSFDLTTLTTVKNNYSNSANAVAQHAMVATNKSTTNNNKQISQLVNKQIKQISSYPINILNQLNENMFYVYAALLMMAGTTALFFFFTPPAIASVHYKNHFVLRNRKQLELMKLFRLPKQLHKQLTDFMITGNNYFVIEKTVAELIYPNHLQTKFMSASAFATNSNNVVPNNNFLIGSHKFSYENISHSYFYSYIFIPYHSVYSPSLLKSGFWESKIITRTVKVKDFS